MPYSSFPLQVSPTIPQPLRRLADLAENFWFSWYPETGQLFRKLDAVLWRKVEGNPKLFLRCVDQGILDRAAADGPYLAEYEDLIGRVRRVFARAGRREARRPRSGRPRRVFLRRVRSARELPDLFGRPRRARGRPLQDRQRPKAAVCRGRVALPAGVLQPADRPQRPAALGLHSDRAALDGAHGRARRRGPRAPRHVPVPGSRRRVARLARGRRPGVGAAARHRRARRTRPRIGESPTFFTAATASTASARRPCSASAACAPCARSGSRRRCGTSTRVTPRSR